MFVLKPESGVPLYRQLVDQVRGRIESGALRVGDTLPSVRSLALDHAINPMTISKAYALLEAEGWLERHPGKPMTVADPRRQANRNKREAALESRLRELVSIARRLGLEADAVASLVHEHWENNHD